MFKHYLTYQLALSFHQACTQIHAQPQVKHRVLRSSENLVHHFAKALHTKDMKEELAQLCVALLNLRDCMETLVEAKIALDEFEGRYKVLHDRIEQICLHLAENQGGQLRLLG